MDRLDVQIKLVAECSQSLNSKFMEDFNQVAEEALRVQTQINHRIKDLHSGFFDQHSNLSSELRELNRIRTTLEDACVLMTKSLLGIEADSSTEKLEKEISNRVKELEEDRAKLNEMQKALELREECVRERLNHLEEMRRQQRKRLQGELDSSYLGLFRSLKRLRSEFEETYTCEEVATSLALDTEKKAAEKAHAACKKMFRSAENRVRRMEAVRRKRLAAFRSTLDELDQQLADTEDTPFEDGSGENSAANVQPISCRLGLIRKTTTSESPSAKELRESPSRDPDSDPEAGHVDIPSESPYPERIQLGTPVSASDFAEPSSSLRSDLDS